jgi:hypothetical protein
MPDAGMMPGVDASTTEPPQEDLGGCCDAGRSTRPAGLLFGVLILGLILRRRR